MERFDVRTFPIDMISNISATKYMQFIIDFLNYLNYYILIETIGKIDYIQICKIDIYILVRSIGNFGKNLFN